MKNILEYLEKSAEKFPEKTVVGDETTQMTYRGLLAEAKAIGSLLLARGVGRAPVAVLLGRTAGSLAAMMGVVYAGCCYTVLDHEMPAARMKLILRDLSPAAVLTDDQLAPKIREAGYEGRILLMEEALGFTPDREALLAVRERSIDTDPVYILFTSGSTGVPKGTVVCHRSVIAYTEWVGNTFGLGEDTVFGNQTPFYFSMSVLDIFSTMRNGATMQIIPKMLFAFPGRLIEFLTERKINTLYWVPSALAVVANWKVFDFVQAPPIRTVLFAGEVMMAKVLNYWVRHLEGALFANLYGPTEVTDICTYYIVNRRFADDEAIPIGKACDNCDVLVVTPGGREAGPEEEGELYVRGSFLAMGYYGNPQKTAEAFVQNPLQINYPETVYRTGDIVRRSRGGELMYVTRKDFQIKHMGYRIELGEIEAAAGAVDGVMSCACIYDAPGDRIILFYQQSSDEAGETTLRRALRKKLPAYMLPARLIRLERMYYNANGKIDRNRLRAEYDKLRKGTQTNGKTAADPQ